MKEVGLRIRLELDLRDAFVRSCRAKGVPASQVIRAFMRSYVDRQPTDIQGDLFLKEQRTDSDFSEQSA